MNPEKHYKEFKIPKRNGKFRTIEAPDGKLKKKQSKILKELEKREVFKPSYFVHSFMRGRNIVTAAKPHVGKKYLAKMDIEDFFRSITWNKFASIMDLRGVHKRPSIHDGNKEFWKFSKNFKLKKWCFRKRKGEDEFYLPQGAPTSPWLSNALLKGFDWKTARLSAYPAVKKHLQKNMVVYYSRYADDIFLSSNKDWWLKKVMNNIKSNLYYFNLALNNKKTHVFGPGRRKMVCGLIVNEKLQLPKRKRKLIRAIKHRQQFESVGKREKGFLALDFMVKNWDKFPANNVEVSKTIFTLSKV